MPKALLLPFLALLILGFATRVAKSQVPVRAVPPALAAGVVQSYFDAFRRLDRHALDGVTVGKAADETRRMLDTLRAEAKRQNVGLELQVKDLSITPRGSQGGAMAVNAKFELAVVAKKWFFSKVARVITGTGTFYVGKNLAAGDMTEAKIVGMELRFD